MTFAFNPDDGPPRLIRYVDELHDAIQVGTIVAKIPVLARYQKEDNLLIINRPEYEKLPDPRKKQVLRTHSARLAIPTRQPRKREENLQFEIQ